MAGYLFTFGDEPSLFESIKRGSYSTLMNPKWNDTVASTLGDYVTMRPGDSVHFFSKRTIYGVGEIVAVTAETVAAETYEGASLKPKVEYAFINLNSIVDDPIVTTENGEKVKRWVITFKPSPHFFATGIDMDDLLLSNPKAFRSLRVFERRSFIKLDDEEDAAFKAALLRRNIKALYNPTSESVLGCDFEYAVGRPARPEEWHNLRFIEYHADESGLITFTEIRFGTENGESNKDTLLLFD